MQWRTPSEIVQLRGQSGVGDYCSRHYMDSTMRVLVGLSKHYSPGQFSQCQLVVYLEVGSILTVGKLRLDEDKIYLREGNSPNRIMATRTSWTNDWTRPFLGADGEFYFEVGDLDSNQARSTPFVIYLDSVMTFNQQVMDIGRIEFDGCNPDSARYVY